MSQICIYLNLDPYLGQWLVNDNGGHQPVQLPRGSVESKILEIFLAKRPPDSTPEPPAGRVAIQIPSFKVKPAEIYNYLPRRAERALVEHIRKRFDVALWRDLHVFGKIIHRQDELIYSWMEKNGIELTEGNWNAIAKRYQRQRQVYEKRQAAKINYQKNTSKKPS